MTFPRDLARQQPDLAYRSSIAYRFARYALGLKYPSIPKEVLHQVKRSLLDALGCTLGATNDPGRSSRPQESRSYFNSWEFAAEMAGSRSKQVIEARGFPTPRKK